MNSVSISNCTYHSQIYLHCFELLHFICWMHHRNVLQVPPTHFTPKKPPPKDRPVMRKSSNLMRTLGIAILIASLYTLSGRITYQNFLFDPSATADATALALQALQEKQIPGSTGNMAMAFATKVSPARISVFVRSFAEHSPGTKLVIFTDPVLLDNPQIKELYKEYKVLGVKFAPPPEIEDPDDDEELRKPGRLILAAYEKYQEHLETKADWAQAVILFTNCRDVVLQSDPFLHAGTISTINRDAVLISTEGGAQFGDVLIKNHFTTTRSLNECFGSTVANKLADKPLLNADAIVGSRQAMRMFVTLMADIMATRVRVRCLRNPRADMAVLQYAIQDFGRATYNLDFTYVVRDHTMAPVYGIAYGFPVRLDLRGQVKRAVGRAPNVLTQYGAHPVLMQFFINKYKTPSGVLDFMQTSGYVGDDLPRSNKLPMSWETAAKEQAADLSEAKGVRVGVDEAIERMIRKERKRVEKEWDGIEEGAKSGDSLLNFAERRRTIGKKGALTGSGGGGGGNNGSKSKVVEEDKEQVGIYAENADTGDGNNSADLDVSNEAEAVAIGAEEQEATGGAEQEEFLVGLVERSPIMMKNNK